MAAQRLVESKLRLPPLSAETILRPRVDEMLRRAASRHSVVLVVAAPGAGKTTAAAQFVQAQGPWGWLSLDEADSRPGRLVTYLTASVGRVVPHAAADVRAMLDDGLAPVECAPLLAEMMPAGSAVVVDDIHHLVGSEPCLALLRGFVRHMPPGATVLLLGRRLPPLGLEREVLADQVGGVFDHELAFTPDETSALLRARGSPAEAGAMHRATGGWAAGLVFDALRASPRGAALPPGEDALYAYLGSEVLRDLSDAHRDLLLRSSVLDQVTPDALRALVDADCAAGFDALCRLHLPAVTEPGVIRYHPRFREFLRHRLAVELPGEARDLALRHGRMLAREGFHEEAADTLIGAGHATTAVASVEAATPLLIRRGDWDKVVHWCREIGEDALAANGALRGAQVRALLLGRRQEEVEALVQRMIGSGELARLSRDAPDVVGWAVWALHASGEWPRLLRLLPEDARGRAAVARHLFAVTSASHPPVLPEGTSLDRPQPLHVALQSAFYYQGRFDEVEGLADSAAKRGPVTAALGQIYRVAALREHGDAAAARVTLDAVAPRVRASRYLEFWHQVEGELVFEEGDQEEALRLAREARRLSRRHGYRIGDRALFAVSEGKMLVRMGLSDEARPVLDDARAWCDARGLRGFGEWASVWSSAAQLMSGDDPHATRAQLVQAVGAMRAAERRLELAAGAVFLAEACWRCGDEEGHDAACDLAYATAEAQGTLAPLLRAVHLVPDVLARRVDASPPGDHRWPSLRRVIPAPPAVTRPRVRLLTLGPAGLEVDGEPRRVGLGKAFELAVILEGARPHGVARERLIDELFGDSADGANYLRQALHRLRRVLPDGVTVRARDGVVAWEPPDAVTSADRDLEHAVALGRTLLGAPRAACLARALAAVEDGPFMPGSEESGLVARRRFLDDLEADVRGEVAEAAIVAGRPAEALAVLTAGLERAPLREDLWQLLMRTRAEMDGPEVVAGILADCHDVLRGFGLAPCATTVATADGLRAARTHVR